MALSAVQVPALYRIIIRFPNALTLTSTVKDSMTKASLPVWIAFAKTVTAYTVNRNSTHYAGT